MLRKTQMQEIQDLKLRGYTKTEILTYYKEQGLKPPSRPTISKYYDMDVIPEDPEKSLLKTRHLMFRLLRKPSFPFWKRTAEKISAYPLFMISSRRNSLKTDRLTAFRKMSRPCVIMSIIWKKADRSIPVTSIAGSMIMCLILLRENRC